MAELKRAQKLDPLFPPMALGGVLYEMGLYDRAIAVFKDWLEMNPGYPSVIAWLANCYVKKNIYEEAISRAREALTLSGNPVFFQAWLARIYAQTGNKDDARKTLEEVRRRGNDIDPEYIASVYAALDDKELAFEWLERAYERHSDRLLWGLKSAAYELLRTDPRYADLVRRIGFPE